MKSPIKINYGLQFEAIIFPVLFFGSIGTAAIHYKGSLVIGSLLFIPPLILVILSIFFRKFIIIESKHIVLPNGLFTSGSLTIPIKTIKTATTHGTRYRTTLVLHSKSGESYRINALLLKYKDTIQLLDMFQNQTERALRNALKKWIVLTIMPGFISAVLAFFFNLYFSRPLATDIFPLVALSSIPTFITIYYFNSMTPRISSLKWFQTILPRLLSVISCTYFFYVLLSVVNFHFDKSAGEKSTSNLIHDPNGCYRLSHWKTGKPIMTGDSLFCRQNITPENKVEYLLHEGFLKVPWISEMKLVGLRE